MFLQKQNQETRCCFQLTWLWAHAWFKNCMFFSTGLFLYLILHYTEPLLNLVMRIRCLLPPHVGNEDIQLANGLLCQRYIQNRYIPPQDDWPPYHPKHYTPLTIIHHEGRRTETEVIIVAQEMVRGDSVGRTTKSVSDLLFPFEENNIAPYTILVEGAPGIGKTILSKEIALQWADHNMLHNIKFLFLLFLRDPRVKNITNISSLVNYFYEGNALVSKITDWLVKTDGEYLTIVLDGYDEVSEGCNFFINDIINRKKLTKCGLVITSRPTASSNLHSIVDCRAEVLGFTEEDRQDFIQNALSNQNGLIKDLKSFLQSNPFLNTLCYIPLNMSILLCLTEDGIDTLPKTQTKLYEKFVTMTIVHFLKKDKKITTGTITNFSDLPHPYYQVVKELSQFAFLALQKDQLVFTLVEVKAAYPNLTPANWYGLGLLKPVGYFKPQDGSDHESFHFLHFSIQEYMAAHHIASLPNKMQLKILNDTFWNVQYCNTWIMYVGITGGNRFVFKHFLSGNWFKMSSHLIKNSALSNKILKDKIKCLHLLHCLAEADHEMLPSVENIFQGGVIDLSHQSLSPNDVHTLAVLLLRSPNKQWEMINLSNCNIDEKCCNVLCEMFHSQSVTVKTVDISNNDIHWESLSKFSDILRFWNTKEVIISIDSLYNCTNTKMINNFSNKLRSAIGRNRFNNRMLVNYIPKQNKMIVVCENDGYINCAQFNNCSLNDDMIGILKNFTKQINISRIANIDVSVYISKESVYMLPANIHVTICGSNLHSKGAYSMNIASVIYQINPRNTVVDYLAAVVYHSGQSCASYLNTLPSALCVATRNQLQNFTTLKTFVILSSEIGYEAADDIAVILSHNTKLQQLYLGGNNLQTAGAIKIARALQSTTTLTIFGMGNNNISDEAADDIAVVLSNNTKLQQLYLGGNNLQTAGAIKIAKALQSTTTLTIFGMGNNNISDEAANDIAVVLSNNTKLQVLRLGGNNLQTAGAIKIAKALQNTTTLKIFDINNNNISDEAADDIAVVLSNNTKLQQLYLGGNNLQTAGAIKIAKALQSITTLTIFGMKKNNISDEAADDIAVVLSNNTKLQDLRLGGNNLQTAGAIKIAKALQSTTTLTIFGMGKNNISDEAADDIAVVLSNNTKLQGLDLDRNNLQTAGAIKIAKALQSTTTLTIFGMGKNNISDEAADDIAIALSNNTKLQQLYLGGNNLQTAGTIKIAKALQSTTTLTIFGMEKNNISDEATDDIAVVLSNNTKLQDLRLGGNNLQTAGAIKIAKALQSTTTLTIFGMGNNNISDEAADDIAVVLSNNTKLQQLYLGGNNLQTAGAIKIAKALQSTTALTLFGIDNNKISDEAADDIAVVLSNNTKLQKLYLGGNNLQTAGAIEIARALQTTTTLTIFDMNNNNISDEAADEIASFFSYTVQLKL